MEAIVSSLEPQLHFAIVHSSDISAARRAGESLARASGFSEIRSGQLAIVITEVATNILKHANDGFVVLTKISRNGLFGIEVLATDRGPGISDFGLSQRDGVSTSGTAGTGLGAMRRLADEFDYYSMTGKGSAFCLRLWQGDIPPPGSVDTGAVCVPVAGEEVCGDGWAVAIGEAQVTVLVSDGLGHGPDAARASINAIEAFSVAPHHCVASLVNTAHTALRTTRGAALAFAQIHLASQTLGFAGIGNISACVIDQGNRRQLVSHNGIVGHNVRKVQEFIVECPRGALVILLSDGINTQWDLGQYPGLALRAPSLIAAVLLRDFARVRDDATVLVLRINSA